MAADAGERAEQGEPVAAGTAATEPVTTPAAMATTAAPGSAATTTTSTAARVATPLLSIRRAPEVVAAPLASQALTAALDAVGARVPAGSCLTVAVDGRTVHDTGGDVPVIPASTLKLATAAVALDVLGPDHRFTTTVRASGPVLDGRLDGDLHLVGGGDPVLSTDAYPDAARARNRRPPEPRTRLEELADAVAAAGVRQVTGSVIGDETRYDAVRTVPSWPPDYLAAAEGGPLSALLVDDGYAPATAARPAPDPARAAAATFTRLLAERGVRVAGPPASGAAPTGATEVASLTSPPLEAIVAELLTTSDNNTGELLVKELGVARAGAGTTEAGRRVVADTLASWGLPVDGLVVTDGSGLDRTNRLTCDTLVGVLEHGGAEGVVARSLPVAGRTGTLEQAFVDTPMEGRLRAKTGTLRQVRALAGFAPVGAAGASIDDAAPTATFAVVVNGPDATATASALWVALADALARYQPVDPTPFGPRPAV